MPLLFLDRKLDTIFLNQNEMFHFHVKFLGDTRNTYSEDLICTTSTGSISTRLSDSQSQDGYISTGWEDTRLMFCTKNGTVRQEVLAVPKGSRVRDTSTQVWETTRKNLKDTFQRS